MVGATVLSAPASRAEPPRVPPIAELVDRVHAVVKASLGHVQGTLGAASITYGQFWALHTVAARGATSMREVARSLGVSPPTVCAAVDQLETAGLVVRRRSARDRREVDLALTPRGRRVEARVWAELTRVMTEAGAEIPERDLAAAVRVFRALAARLGAPGRSSRRAP